MSSGILTLTQQPRWLLLSLFLILWSWSTGLRRDGKALGLGVDARAAPASTWELKRVVGLPMCAEQCALQAQEAIGCGDSLNLQCACHSAQFFPGAVDCMTANCTASDKQNGQEALMTACRAVGTSVSLPTSFTGTSTSITSGVPSISGSAPTTATTTSPSSATSSTRSGGSGSATATTTPTTTGTGTATATTTATAPPSSTTGTGSSIESSSSGGTTATGTSTQASGSSSTPSSTSTSTSTSTGTSGNGAGTRAASLSWPAVAVGVLLAVAGSAASL